MFRHRPPKIVMTLVVLKVQRNWLDKQIGVLLIITNYQLRQKALGKKTNGVEPKSLFSGGRNSTAIGPPVPIG